MRVMENTKLLYNRKEAANALSLGIRTLDQLVSSGQLPARRIGRRVLIPKRSIEDFASQPQTARGEKTVGDSKPS